MPPTPLNFLATPWSFFIWGINMTRLIEPKASNGKRFIFVAIDYFTKWVEVTYYANVTRQVMARFIKKEIICHYGIPNKIIIDNRSNLNNKMMKELCKNFKIEHHNSSPYHPKTNSVAEAENKYIKKIIQKMVITYKYWHEMLILLCAYIRRQSTRKKGQPPLLYMAWKQYFSSKLKPPSLRVLMETKLE